MSSCDGMFILLGGLGIMRALVGNYFWEKVPLLSTFVVEGILERRL
jgi:hypothetical protein